MEILDDFLIRFRNDASTGHIEFESVEIIEQMVKVVHAALWAFDVNFDKESVDEFEKEIEALEKLT